MRKQGPRGWFGFESPIAKKGPNQGATRRSSTKIDGIDIERLGGEG